MIIVTSLSPSHCNKELQADCIKSWLPYGPVYSLNTKKEIYMIGPGNYADVYMKPTDKTMESLFGKTLVNICAFFDLAKAESEDLLIINSDIYVKDLPELKEDGVTVFSRYDYHDTMDQSLLFKNGFDAFFIPHKFLHLYPPSLYAQGSTWWDFALPYIYLLNDVPLYYPKRRHLFHKFHKNQYSYAEWLWIGEMFTWQFKLGRDKKTNKELIVQQVCTETLALIKSKFIYV